MQVNGIARMFLSSEEMAAKPMRQARKMGHPRRPSSWKSNSIRSVPHNAAGVHKLAAQSPRHPVRGAAQTSQHDDDLAGSWAISIVARAKAAEAAAMKDAASLAATRMINSNKLASFTKGLGLGLEKMNPQFRLEFDKKAQWIIKEQKEAEERAQQEKAEAESGGHHDDSVPLPPTGGAVVNTVTGGSSSQGGSSSSGVHAEGVQNPNVQGENHVIEGEPGSVEVRTCLSCHACTRACVCTVHSMHGELLPRIV
jgi:hypothetical protein